MQRAAKSKGRYRAFHGKDVDTERRARLRVPAPGETLWALGELEAIVYRRPGEKVPYEHVFKRPRAMLCSDSEGRRLYIVGGGYRVTSRGIVK